MIKTTRYQTLSSLANKNFACLVTIFLNSFLVWGLSVCNLEASLTVSGSPFPLEISHASAGSNPTSVYDSSTSYSLASSSSNSRIVGAIESSMPPHTSLKVTLAAPSGASSTGTKTLSTTNQDLVINIPVTSQNGLAISYEFSATCAAGVVSPFSKVVTFTLLP